MATDPSLQGGAALHRAALAQAPDPDVPRVELPRAPEPALIWSRGLRTASILNLVFTLNQLTLLIANFWLLQSLKLESVFWTNFAMGAKLWAIAFVTMLAAFALPALTHPLPRRHRKLTIELGVLSASIAAYLMCLTYDSFLLGGSASVPFEKVDPVFGHDLSFYVYHLDNIWASWHLVFWSSLFAVVVSVICAWRTRDPGRNAEMTGVARFLAEIGTRSTQVALGIWGLAAAAGMWLTRYDLLFRDNKDSSVWTGAEALDVTGIFSNLNYVYLTTFLMMVDDFALIAVLVVLRNMYRGRARTEIRPLRALAVTYAALLVLDFGFKVLVEVRNWTSIKPNEPVVQLPFIQRNLEATRAAFHLDDVEEIEYVPKGPLDPPADIERLLQSETLRQAPLWPGFSSYLERHLDIQHANRVFLTGGDPMIYGPTLEVFRQEQQLRTYYDFLGIDAVRYWIDGKKQMFVSAAREAPLLEPSPWLAYWGQRFMLFTHGFGLVMAPMSTRDAEGGPDYVSYDIPSRDRHPELAVENPRIYYGEGSATMAFSNVDQMKELDYPTDQGRAEIFLPSEVDAGVRIDTPLKRLVFGWRSDRFFEILFSDLIKDGTRIHFYRTPLERIRQVAPFLYVDPNVYAVAADGGIQWIANAMTTSDAYPYSWPAQLGDKSDNRSPFPGKEERWVNYVEDSVKVAMDAFTGQLRLYAISDEPLISTYRQIYPDLFVSGDAMPQSIKRQITYPLHFFHTQFDDHYIYYHMADPMYFFNMEDMWDDGDDVLGPMLDQGKAITFSIEPYPLMLETGGILPAAEERLQFALMGVFTPESALNLRAIPIAYQDGVDYGRKVVLSVPKGTYVPSPEQADAAIDQDPSISQFFSWWTRRGMEVVRGHTTLLPIEDEVLYVEPVFLRSRQQQVTQLKKVVVVYRGKPVMRDTLEEALRAAVAGAPSNDELPPDIDTDAGEQARQAAIAGGDERPSQALEGIAR